jgi:hypothetical protein
MLGAMTGLFNRERARIGNELRQVSGLMPLLMKQRNGQPWTREERDQLRAHLRRLYGVSPYLVAFALPGSPLLVPLLAWWLDRRRIQRSPDRQHVPPGSLS